VAALFTWRYTSAQIENNKVGWECSTYAEEDLVEERGGKRKRLRPRRTWEDNTKNNLQDIG
jgi:hypothetical protein